MKVYNIEPLSKRTSWNSLLERRANCFVEKEKFMLDSTLKKKSGVGTGRLIGSYPVIFSGRYQYHGADYEDL